MVEHDTSKRKTSRNHATQAAPGYSWPPADPKLQERMEALMAAAGACVDRCVDVLGRSIENESGEPDAGPEALMQDMALFARAAIACAETHGDLAFGRYVLPPSERDEP